MKNLNESVEIVYVSESSPLTLDKIEYVMKRAAVNHCYAKFITGDLYIQISFQVDGTLAVASNIRSIVFLNDLWWQNKSGWTWLRAKTFIYQWMQLGRKMIY